MIQYHCVVRLYSHTDLYGKQMMLKNNVVLYTVLILTQLLLSCVHFPLCDKDIFQTEVIQTVIYHLREFSLRTEVEGSVKDECPTHAISNRSCVSSGT